MADQTGEPATATKRTEIASFADGINGCADGGEQCFPNG
jgi:hypothetical protein